MYLFQLLMCLLGFLIQQLSYLGIVFLHLLNTVFFLASKIVLAFSTQIIWPTLPIAGQVVSLVALRGAWYCRCSRSHSKSPCPLHCLLQFLLLYLHNWGLIEVVNAKINMLEAFWNAQIHHLHWKARVTVTLTVYLIWPVYGLFPCYASDYIQTVISKRSLRAHSIRPCSLSKWQSPLMHGIHINREGIAGH